MRLLKVKLRPECYRFHESKYIQLNKDLYLKWGWKRANSFNKGIYSSPKKANYTDWISGL